MNDGLKGYTMRAIGASFLGGLLFFGGCSLLVNGILNDGEEDDNCGDGIARGREECDDGNLTDGDGCDSDCTVTQCGNGIAAGGEPCDDGNAVDGDGCDTNCTFTACGNGIITNGEDCEDGNSFNGDGCSADCDVEFCGDNIINNGEECDDGGIIAGDGCDDQCRSELDNCGNGVADPGEECDGADLEGASCGGLGLGGGVLVCSAACSLDVGGCTCGNGIPEPGEFCPFSDPSAVDVIGVPSSIAVNFSADADQIAVVNEATNEIEFFLVQGGVLTRQAITVTTGSAPSFLFSARGSFPLFVANKAGGSISQANDANALAPEFDSVDAPVGLTLVDVDADSDLDLLSLGGDANNLGLHLNQGPVGGPVALAPGVELLLDPGSLNATVITPVIVPFIGGQEVLIGGLDGVFVYGVTANGANFLTAVDVPDVVDVQELDAATVAVLTGSDGVKIVSSIDVLGCDLAPNGCITREVDVNAAVSVRLALGDFDHEFTRNDLAVLGLDGSVTFVLVSIGGNISTKQILLEGFASTPTDIQVHDLDGDQNDDIVISGKAPGKLAVLFGSN